MGGYFNFKNLGNEQTEGSGGGRPPGNFPLARQSSIYSMTFDEFQSTTGGIGKDFGSMNMDELLKNIWSAEEMQTIGFTSGAGQDVVTSAGYLQRQGSITLPRTLSQKTVDEVWKDMSKEFAVGGKDNNSVGYMSMPQRQPTLGEITVEEFLLRAGIVREDAQFAGKPNTNGILGDISRTVNNQALGFGYQQPGRNTGLVGGRILESSNQMAMESTKLPLNVNGIRSTQQQLGATQIQQTQQQQQQPLLPKQPALAYSASIAIPISGQFGSPGVRGGIVGISDPASSASLVQNGTLPGAGVGIVNLGAGAVTVATGSPAVSSDGLGKSNGDTSSVSPVPYVFNGSLRGRKSSALEKVVERRQRRMIKNRESAARSRARKQAYTTELEAEVANLKAENQELLKKQAEMLELQKCQVMEVMNLQHGGKRRCLRRMQTGPW